MSFSINSGKPHPLGATLKGNNCNFAVNAPDAEDVFLCLFSPDTEALIGEYRLPGKTGNIRHGMIPNLAFETLYSYKVLEQKDKKLANRFLIDPYAKQLNRACYWDQKQYDKGGQFMLPKGIVSGSFTPAKRVKFDKHESKIIYEAHVKGISQLHPDVPETERGTYLGAAHPSIINHLKTLGVTTVQFLPLASFMAEPFITEKGLTNYWGYNPINFFAAEPRYAIRNAMTECRAMVESYHDAGLEVIVDVVFNHTAEAGDDGPVLSFRGLCANQAYLYERSDDGSVHYINHSGCGNSVNIAHPDMLTLVMDALRHWVEVIGVDGFRFDLAASLGRDPLAFDHHAAFFRAVQQDPILKEALLIAEPWDIGLGGYQVGGFPLGWRECNDKFRDTVRSFWRSDKGVTSDFATRIMGSRDIFHKGAKPISTSVNMVTYHDGFTLHDLVSYSDKHNEANLEENRDGHSHNLSANYGVEGETRNSKILALRERQKRNLFTTLMLSQGTPHILGGDELSRSQRGNNNSYCQDNALNWFNWELNKTQQDFLHFCQEVIRIRNESQLFQHLQMPDDHFYANANVQKIRWYKPDGTKKAPRDWHQAENQAFALELISTSDDTDTVNEHWLLCFNASNDDVRFTLPSQTDKGGWTLRLDTRYHSLAEQPQVCLPNMFLQAGLSIVILTYSS